MIFVFVVCALLPITVAAVLSRADADADCGAFVLASLVRATRRRSSGDGNGRRLTRRASRHKSRTI